MASTEQPRRLRVACVISTMRAAKLDHFLEPNPWVSCSLVTGPVHELDSGYDVVLHRAPDDLALESALAGQGERDERAGDAEEAMCRLEMLRRTRIPLLGSLQASERVMRRRRMRSVLESACGDHSGVQVRVPRARFIASSAEWDEAARDAAVPFPAVIKSDLACCALIWRDSPFSVPRVGQGAPHARNATHCRGTRRAGAPEAHRMHFLPARELMAEIRPKISFPCVLEEYVPHGNVVVKAYVVGAELDLRSRPTLEASAGGGGVLSFDSQSLCKAPGPGDALAGGEDGGEDRSPSALHVHPVRGDAGDGGAKGRRIGLSPPLHDAAVRYTAALRRESGLPLFGLDLLVEARSDSACGAGLVAIDVNFWPSMKGFPGLHKALHGLACDAVAPQPRRNAMTGCPRPLV